MIGAFKNDDENWVNKKWRPAMGWMYMAVCITDFILYPVLWAIIQTISNTPVKPWEPLTLQGAGLFHIAMGAVLGVSAWSRGKEKIAGASIQPTVDNLPVLNKSVEEPYLTDSPFKKPSQPPHPLI